MALNDQRRAYVLALSAVLLWSTVATAFKLSLEHLAPIELLAWASLVSLLTLGLLLLGRSTRASPDRRRNARILACRIAGLECGMTGEKHFISDNAAGVHPDVLAALARVNEGHVPAYGEDAITARAVQTLRSDFGPRCEVLLALTGTGANVFALQSLIQSWQAVICADSSHLHHDECGAAEKFTGSKMLTAASVEGKLTPAALEPLLADSGMVHRVQPRVVSVSQCTEWGTVYRPAELAALADWCHTHGILLHVDGARLCNAAAALDCSLAAITTDCGVDVVSVGGTKNGAMGAEAVVFLDAALAAHAGYCRKQAMQLASKMRYVAAQFEALFESELWRRNALHANAMAARLARAVADVDRLEIVMPVESNAVFARLPREAIAPLQRESAFVVWRSADAIVRWMTSWDTTEGDVDRFAELVRRTLQSLTDCADGPG